VGKSLLYRLFNLGSIPEKLAPVLKQEGIVVADEGLTGWFRTRDVAAPGKRHIRRSRWFCGCLVITKMRILCHAFGKRQINLPVGDARLSRLSVDLPGENLLLISFESSDFLPGWKGRIEFLFRTEEAGEFRDVLLSLGAKPGSHI
jgi:hypothetical protein